jgi:beta-galactosidase
MFVVRPSRAKNPRSLHGLALRTCGLLVFGMIVTSAGPASAGQSPSVIQIDASAPYSEPGPAAYDGGTMTSPAGHVLGLNERYLTFDGKPWLPVMGEFHFSRYPRDEWEEELLKMKAAGVNIVSTYVLWIYHEEVQGQFDWSGERDLRAFAQLCSKHGLLLVARIGPWDHAEVRNGGLPDWVLKQGPTRVNDPLYLASSRAWYEQVGQQLKGLLWKDGGPVIGIQLENEYSRRGPGAGEEHILKLKELAVASGFDVPYYFVTGWDGAVVPKRAVLPVFGGYPDAPWDESTAMLPPSEVYAFRFHSRVASFMGVGGGTKTAGADPPGPERLPYLTAELGGGNEVTYHRRPVIRAEDISTMVPVMLGSGVNLYGTYMFHGGENPDGKLTTLQESQATNYPNDVPIKSYDFQAPLGEFGQERESLKKLKVYQYFLNDFGELLAPMTVRPPASLPKSLGDFSVPRVSVRSRGDSGFIFFNNYVRDYAMPARPATQFEVRLPGCAITVPRKPIDLPSGASFIWPFNLSISGIRIHYATAQLFTRIAGSDATTVYFEALPGIDPEFAFDEPSIRRVEHASGVETRDGGIVYLSGIVPGENSPIDLVSADGNKLHIVVLTAAEAENAWKTRIAGQDSLLMTDQEFFADEAQIWLRSEGSPAFSFTVTPPAALLPNASIALHRAGADGSWESFTATAEASDPKLEFHLVQAPGEAPEVKLGPRMPWRMHSVAEAPPEGPLPGAGRWSIQIPGNALSGLANVFLRVSYEGDVARLARSGKLLDDDFYNGYPWSIGLKRFLHPGKDNSFDLSILPLRKDAPIFLQPPNPIQFDAKQQVCKLKSLTLVPEYELAIDTGNR